MNVVIIIIILTEVLYLILGSYYLMVKTKIKYLTKYIMILMYFITMIIFNISIINLFSYNYIRNNSYSNLDILKEEISNLKLNINNNEDILVELENDVSNYGKVKEELDSLNKENRTYIKNIEIKEEEVNVLEERLNKLEDEYSDLIKKSKYVISPFPTYNQFPNYPNGCESVALYLLLKYNGVDVSVEEIVEKLKKGDSPFRKNGKLYGGDPEIEFVGDPRSKTGYGVYEKPIIDVAESFKSGIKNITGSSLNEVLKIVKLGKPVQVWASINLRNTYVCSTWTATSTGRTINWLCGLHSLVVIGYSYEKIITSDPYTGKIEYYDKIQFEKMYNTYGKRALYYE